MSAQATRLLNAFKILDQAKTNGRKAHAQLLVSSDHDISHINKLERELADFEHTCRSIRGDLPIPDNTAEVSELLEKWKREQGPSRVLKAAVNGNDIAALREVCLRSTYVQPFLPRFFPRLAPSLPCSRHAARGTSHQVFMAKPLTKSLAALRITIEGACPHWLLPP